MTHKIAIILDDAKQLSSFEEGTTLFLYYKEIDSWQLKKEFRYNLDFTLSSASIRDYIRTLILKMGDCKIIVGKTISGLPYSILNRMGFEIFEAPSISKDMMDEIIYEVENLKSSLTKDCPNETSPTETDIKGVYQLNLADVLEHHPEVSSKKALQPFIETTPFYTLEVICSHIPPWFEGYFNSKRLVYNVEDLGKSMYKVIIMKKVCDT